MNQKFGRPQSSANAHLQILMLSVENFLNAKNERKVSELNNLIVVYDSIKDSHSEVDYASCSNRK